MALDWTQPWLQPWRQRGEPLEQRVAAGAPLHEALAASGPTPVRFVPQQALPAGTAYEQFIFDTGQCPVRPGLHDFFNGLAWLQFPRSKAALNALQAREIARLGVVARRGAVRDAITVFDENGALLQAPPPLWEALRAREWRRLFVELRPLWSDARLLVFGHALLEQLAAPRKGLTAHVWCGQAALESGAAADAWLAGACTAQALAGKPFTPLPVLGIPGWWPENANFSFYDDSFIFRPPRVPEPTTTRKSPGPERS